MLVNVKNLSPRLDNWVSVRCKLRRFVFDRPPQGGKYSHDPRSFFTTFTFGFSINISVNLVQLSEQNLLQ